MTISIVELTNDLRPLDRDPSYNPNVFSESDDDLLGNLAFFRKIKIQMKSDTT